MHKMFSLWRKILYFLRHKNMILQKQQQSKFQFMYTIKNSSRRRGRQLRKGMHVQKWTWSYWKSNISNISLNVVSSFLSTILWRGQTFFLMKSNNFFKVRLAPKKNLLYYGNLQFLKSGLNISLKKW